MCILKNSMTQLINKTKFVHVKPSIYIDFNKENNKEDPKLIVLEYHYVKMFLQKAMFQIDLLL